MSKLRKKIQLLFLALLPTLMGCSADDSLVLLPNNTEEELMEIRLCATTTPLADAVVTRLTNSNFEQGDKVGIHIPDYYDNTLFTLGDTYFVSSETCYFPLNQEEVTVTAYYPYNETITDNKLPVRCSIGYIEDATWQDATTDPLWATKTIQKPERNPQQTTTIDIEMAFQHQLACLQLDADNDVTMTNITITFNGSQYGYLDISNGQITSANPTATHPLTWMTANIENGTKTSKISIDERFLPNEDAIASIQIYHNGVNKTIFPTEVINKISLESGKITKIRITNGNNANTRSNNEICLSIEE